MKNRDIHFNALENNIKKLKNNITKGVDVDSLGEYASFSYSEKWINKRFSKSPYIVLSNEVSPSEGFKDIIDNSQSFKADCGTFTQILILYAAYETMTESEFNKEIVSVW